ncbi:MAG: hypothetical protein E6Q97_38715 [Desulfurellales bacterium]|nr:MAG: hypothetical protein E6Q97_38715 [Desulfurellales bacterium]
MKLEAGKWYRTRDGRKAFVGFQNPISKCWVGYIEGEPLQRTWSPGGEWNWPNEYCLDLIAEWTDAPAVGSSAWANSLPVGTKVRWWDGWTSKMYLTKTRLGWDKTHPHLGTPDKTIEKSGWLLYEQKLRQWKAEEVPVGARFRIIGHKWWSFLAGVNTNGNPVMAMTNEPETTNSLFRGWEHSTDNGVTWKPCGSEE